MKHLHKAAPDPPFLSTGCEAFDAILGGGLRSGEICEVVFFSIFFWKGGPFFQSLVYYFCGKVFGASNTGKTQLCLSAVAMCASSGGKVAHFSFFLLVGLLHRITLPKKMKPIMFMLILGCLCGHCWRPLPPKTFRSC